MKKRQEFFITYKEDELTFYRIMGLGEFKGDWSWDQKIGRDGQQSYSSVLSFCFVPACAHTVSEASPK